MTRDETKRSHHTVFSLLRPAVGGLLDQQVWRLGIVFCVVGLTSAVRAVDFSTTSSGIYSDAAIWNPSGFLANGTMNLAGNTATISHPVTFSGGATATPAGTAFQIANGNSLTLNSGGSLDNTSTASWFMAGFSGSQITVHLNGGSVLNPGNAQIAMFGVNGGSALVNINEGTLRAGTNNTQAGGFDFTGASSINVAISNGTSNAAGTVNLGDGSGASGSAVIDLATNNRNLNIGWTAQSTNTGRCKGVVNVTTDGAITAGAASAIRIGRCPALDNEASELNITGGSVSADTVIVGSVFADARGRLSLQSGTLTLAGTNGLLRLGNSNASAQGEFIQSGGIATIRTVEFNHGNSKLELNGGTTTVNSFAYFNPTGTPGVRQLTINGGVLRAGASSASYLPTGAGLIVTMGATGGTIDTNGKDITIAVPITGTGGLTKTGTGTLALNGGHSYQAVTLIDQGVLSVEGSIGGSSVTVKPAGTLGGGGSVTPPISVEGRLSPGGDLITNETAFEEGASFAVSINDWTGGTPGTDWDLLDATDIAFNNTPSSKLTLVISGNPAGFSETPKTLVIAKALTSITGFNATAIDIDDSGFAGTGSWSVQQNGTDIELVYVAGATNTYTAWAASNAGGESADLDHDKDGVPNGVEYFMGETGSSFTANPSVINGRITWPMSAAFNGTYVVKTSTDLVHWSPATSGVSETPGVSVEYTLPTDGSRRFVRMEVTAP